MSQFMRVYFYVHTNPSFNCHLTEKNLFSGSFLAMVEVEGLLKIGTKPFRDGDPSPFVCSVNISFQYNCSHRPITRESLRIGIRIRLRVCEQAIKGS